MTNRMPATISRAWKLFTIENSQQIRSGAVTRLVVRSLILDLHPENGTKEGLLQLYQFQGVVWNDDILRIDRERFRILILIIKGFSRGCRVCDRSTNSPSQCA